MTVTSVVDDPGVALTGAPTWTALDVPAVKTPMDEQNVTDYMNLAKAFQTRVQAFFEPHKKRARAAWQGLVDAEKTALTDAVSTEESCKRALRTYRLECEERERQERLRLEELARTQEEERRIQEAAALETQASATPDLTEAFELRREAEAMIEAPVTTPVVHVESGPKVIGGAYKPKFTGTMTDKARLLMAVAAQCKERPELLALFDLNETQARKLAEMVKVDQKEILPGLVCVRDIVVSGRRR